MHRCFLGSTPNYSSLSILYYYPISRIHCLCSVHVIRRLIARCIVIMSESTSSFWCTGTLISSTHSSWFRRHFYAHFPPQNQTHVLTMKDVMLYSMPNRLSRSNHFGIVIATVSSVTLSWHSPPNILFVVNRFVKSVMTSRLHSSPTLLPSLSYQTQSISS